MTRKSLFSYNEKDAIEFLENRGYIVLKNEEPDTNNSNASILNEFYRLYKSTCDKNLALSGQFNNKEELAAIAEYQEKAKKLGIKKAEANSTLREGIRLLFKYKEQIGLETANLNLRFLLSSSGSWLFKKALEYNKKVLADYDNSIEARLFKESIYLREDDRIKELTEQRHKDLLETDE